MKRVLLSLAFLGAIFLSVAQDTVVVQTLTFDSITTRRGIWQFPEGETFRKILMYHTLKCDVLTQHDQYPCGEWDYLTYNKIHVHTGQYDSTLYYHPNFTLAEGSTPDSLLLSNSPTFYYIQNRHYDVSYPDTMSLEQYEVGYPTEYAYDVIQTDHHSGRSQFLWRAEELQQQGLTAGPVTGIKLRFLQFSNGARHFMIRMQNVDLETLTPDTLINDLDTVYLHEEDFGIGWQDFDFMQPFEWDGTSDVLVDFSFTQPGPYSETGVFGEDPGFDCGITAASDGYALDLDGSADFLKLPADTYFNSDLTFEVWFLKRSNHNWSRIFDFGNGPNKQNVIVVLSKQSSGKLSFHVNKDGTNRSFELEDPTPLNEWTHVTLRLTDHLGWAYINGNFVKLGLLQTPPDIERTVNYIGRSNWSNDGMADVLLDEFRIYNTALEPDEIRAHYRKELEDPQADDRLIVYYDFNEDTGSQIQDLSQYGHDAQGYGLPNRYRIRGPEIFLGFEQYNLRPYIMFQRLESSSVQVEEQAVMDTVMNTQTQIILFQDPDDPTIPTDTVYYWEAGYQYVYEGWQVVDSVWAGPDEVLMREDIPYYGEPFEIIEEYEIGRFITPYGIGLDLGPQGFTWIFDVTDYAPLLRGEVDLSAGNQQELIDLRFEFIEGSPPREVKQIDRVWGKFRSYYYKDLDDDTALSENTLSLLPDAGQFRVKTRLTGHGHNSNTGNYPHCCEWKDNEHYLLVNGQEIAAWHIFQYHQCALNPVYPQGGTWPGAREGWCPGDRVQVMDYEITDYVTGNEVSLDYDITPVPENNQGMGWGNYVIAMHLLQYGENAFDTDAEVYDVISPGDYEYYSRVNPICSDPRIIIRNNGTAPLNSLRIEYGVSGGEQQEYQWTGNLMSHCRDTVTLFVPGNGFWLGDDSHHFTATVSEPNGVQDQYPDNDSFTTKFEMPDLMNEPFITLLKTNNQSWRYSLVVKDIEGNEWLHLDDLENNAYYLDTLDLPDGCYTLELLDTDNMGLTYWAYPEQGVGFFRFLDMDSVIIKHFTSEFGRKIFYTFHVGEESFIADNGMDDLIRIYPNPFDSEINVDPGDLQGDIDIRVFDLQGRQVYFHRYHAIRGTPVRISLKDHPPGVYVVQVSADAALFRQKVVKR